MESKDNRIMNEYKILEGISLFHGIGADDLADILRCLNTVRKRYSRNQPLISEGDEIKSLGIILTGSVQIVREDIAGNRMLVAGLAAGDIFAETLACAGVKESPLGVYANEECTVLWVSVVRMVTTCSNACGFHGLLISNLLRLLAEKNLFLNSRMELLSKRSTREKILAYLIAQPGSNKSGPFEIPLNRNEMADYLCIDRSAMSRELGRLRDEGIIDFHKNHFKFLI